MIPLSPLTRCLVLVSVSSCVWAGDQVREADYAAALQRQPGLQTVQLTAGTASFVGLYRAAERAPQAQAAIILHDVGGHPNQAPIISGLHQQLPMHQWTSLSIQLPLREAAAEIPDYYALFDEAKARIEAATEYLRAQKQQRIVLVGYGVGAAMALYAIQQKPQDYAALAAVSLPVLEGDKPPLRIDEALRVTALPILDIYAEYDLASVVDTANSRRLKGAENPVYRQIRLDGLDHQYSTNPDLLIKRVYSWLNSVDH